MFRVFRGKGSRTFSAVKTCWRRKCDSNSHYRFESRNPRRLLNLQAVQHLTRESTGSDWPPNRKLSPEKRARQVQMNGDSQDSCPCFSTGVPPFGGKVGGFVPGCPACAINSQTPTSRDLSAVSVEAGRTRRPPNQRTEVGFGSKGLGRRVILDILASWSLLARRLLKGDRPIFLTDHLPEVSCLPIEKERVLHLAAAARMRCGIDDRKPVGQRFDLVGSLVRGCACARTFQLLRIIFEGQNGGGQENQREHRRNARKHHMPPIEFRSACVRLG